MWQQKPGGLAKEGSERRAHEAGVSRKTIRKGRGELEAGAVYAPGERMRKPGGGRKKITSKDATLQADLEEMLDPKGDPQSLIRWTSKSVSKVKQALSKQGHGMGETAIRGLLKGMGFSLKANKKTIEGTAHVDRDAQFQHLNRRAKAFEAEGLPVISVDWKKKELLGQFKNNGRAWQAHGQETTLKVYDDLSVADGKAVPYGIYDLVHNSGFVMIMIPLSSPWRAFDAGGNGWERLCTPTATSCSSWRMAVGPMGRATDCGRGSYSTWRARLGSLSASAICLKSNGIKSSIGSCAYISINWRGKPLTSLETVIELISHTTTEEGLTVTALKDTHSYPTGIKVSDDEMAALHLIRDPFHGEWNYTIQPE